MFIFVHNMSSETFNKWKNYTLWFLLIWMTSNFFPGSYNVDTWYQYFEMEEWRFDDWHSPFMAILWKPLYIFTDRFFSLYLLQMAWYFLYFRALNQYFTKRWVVLFSIGSSILLVFIPQYIMKDVLLALSWCTAMVMMFKPEHHHIRLRQTIVIVLIAYGLLLRPNSLPASWPLIMVWLSGFTMFRERRILKCACTFVISLVIFALYYVVLWGVLQAKPSYFTYKYRLADVQGISIMSGKNYMPECITSFPKYDEKRIEKEYTPATNDYLYFWGDSVYPAPTEIRDKCVKEAWVKAIKENPVTYLKCRSIGYAYYLKIMHRVPHNQYWNAMVYVVKNNYIPIDDKHTIYTKALRFGWKILGHTFFFDPWFWLLLNTILAFYFYRRYKRERGQGLKALLALQLCCIIYQLSMFPFFQIDLDFRFNYLNILAAFTGLFFYFDNFAKQKKAAPVVTTVSRSV